MPEITYTCENCHGVFQATNSTEESMAEFAKEFHNSDPSPENIARVCDTCYQKIMSWWQSLPPVNDRVA